jgi:hypothetical protein
VKTQELADGAVTDSKLADSGAMATGAPTGPAGGDLTGTYPDPELRAGRVGPGEIADNAVGPTEIAQGSISSSDVFDQSLRGLDIQNDSLVANDIFTVAKEEDADTEDELPSDFSCSFDNERGQLVLTRAPTGSTLWYCGGVRDGSDEWIPLVDVD